MKPPASLRRLAAAWLLLASLLPTPSDAQIESVTRITARPEHFGRVDFVVILTAEWSDPYRADDVRLDFELTAPSGATVSLPAYYERGPSDRSSVWHACYAPGEVGGYRGQFVLNDGGKRHASAPVAFAVAPSNRRGFLHAATPWVFRFDNGEPFRGIGENLGWEARAADDSRHFKALHENERFNYEYLFGQLATHGGNFTRVWMCPWNLPLEWPRVVDTNRYSDDTGHFNASAIRRIDEFLELADATDVYVMLALDAHGAFLGKLWELNPYNARNGGPAATPAEFFTLPAAKARYKDRLRYLVARWGWSPHLAAWEFFNEIDNAMYEQKPVRIPDDVITAWHAEMSAYLKSIDPYGRLVTTSISHRDVAGLNRITTIDFNQRHIYRATASIPETIRRYVRDDGKPYVIGEFGYEWDWSKDFNEFAGAMDDDFKRGLWLGLFSPTPILPMSWWWEFFDERKLTPYFAGVRSISDRMLAAGHGEFEEIATAAPGLTTLAVRCGSTIFVYALNAGTSEIASDIELAAAISGGTVGVEVFDPETRITRTGPAANVQGEHLTLARITLPAGAQRVFVLRTLPTSAP